jgi:hypothetical protein
VDLRREGREPINKTRAGHLLRSTRANGIKRNVKPLYPLSLDCAYTLKRNRRMSPSFTTYSFPSERISP